MKLSEIIIGKGEYGIPASAVEYLAGMPIYLRITDITDDGFFRPDPVVSFDYSNYKDYEKFKLEYGDIVFARTGNSTGRNYLYSEKDGALYYAGFLIKYKLNPLKVVPEFIGLYCKSDNYRTWIENVSKDGSTRRKMNAQDYLKMSIPDISLSQQRNIVNKIKPLEEKIILNREIIANLEEYSQLLFHKWFVDFNFPNENGEPYKDSGGEMVEVKEKMIPIGWHLSNVGKLSLNFDSKRIPVSDYERINRKGKYPYYGATKIMDYIDDFIFDGTYCLIAEDGSVMDENFRPIMQYVSGKFWVNNHTHVLQGNKVSTEYLYLSLSRTNVMSAITGAIQKKINQQNLNKLPIIQPSEEVSDKFDLIIKPIFSRIEALKKENCLLIEIRDLLINKFTK